MSNVSERISRILKDSRKSQSDFAQSIGVSDRTLRAYLSDSTNPSIDAIQSMAEYYNANCNWIILGEGPIYRDQTPANNVQDTNINVLGKQTIKSSDTPQDTSALYAQIAEMQKQISNLIATNQQLVQKLLKL